MIKDKGTNMVGHLNIVYIFMFCHGDLDIYRQFLFLCGDDDL